MGISYKDVYSPDGAGMNLFDRVNIGTVTAIYPSAATAASATVTVTWGEPLMTPYFVIMSPIEDSTHFFTAKTALGCMLTVNARLATSTLAGGSVEILLIS
jgi:hypothetical protein